MPTDPNIIRGLAFIGLAIAIATASIGASAQDGSREREQIRRLQLRLQGQQEAHAKEIAALEERLHAAQAAATDLKRRLDAEQRDTAVRRRQSERLASQSKQLAELTDAGKTEVARLAERASAAERERDELARQLRDSRSALQDRDRETAACRESIGQRERDLATCTKRNEALYAVGRDVLDRYSRQGLFDRALKAEPLLGIKRVQVENEVQDLRDRLEDGRSLPSKPAR